MPTSRHRSFSLACGLVVAATLSAQDGRLAGALAPMARAATNEATPARVVVSGRGYTATFAADGVRFARPLATHAAAMRWRATAVGRGAVMAELPPRAPQQAPGRVRYEHAAGEERYDVLAAGLEQSFVFTTLPPGDGDLVVRLAVATELPLQGAGPDGLCFGNDKSDAIVWGGVTGIAADGQRARGTITSDGVSIELRLPAAFVARAALPLVLDPLIGTNQLSSPFSSRPDLATFSDTDGTGWLVYDKLPTGSGSRRVWAQRLTETAGVGGPAFEVQFGCEKPAICSIPARGHFVVAYETGTGDIVGQSWDAFGAIHAFTYLESSTNNCVTPDLGGELTAVDDDVLCVFHNTTIDAIQAQQVTVSAAGVLTPASIVTLATAGTFNSYSRPRISKTGGQVGRYLITYENRNLLTSSTSIQAILVTRNLTVLDTLSLGAGDNQDVDGNGNEWVVAFERAGTAGDPDVVAVSLGWSTTSSTLTASPAVAVTALTNTDEMNPAVAWLGNSAIVGWERRAGPGSSDTDLFVKTIDGFTCAGCEPTQLLANTSYAENQLALAAAPGAGTSGRGLVAWRATTSGGSDSLLALGFVGDDGRGSSLVGACGTGGRTAVGCARVGNANFQVRLRSARPAALAWLVLSPATTQLGCGPCSLVADPFIGFLAGPLTTDAGGAAAQLLAIPNSASLGGATFIAQWIVAAAVGTGACTFLDTDFSNGLSVRID